SPAGALLVRSLVTGTRGHWLRKPAPTAPSRASCSAKDSPDLGAMQASRLVFAVAHSSHSTVRHRVIQHRLWPSLHRGYAPCRWTRALTSSLLVHDCCPFVCYHSVWTCFE